MTRPGIVFGVDERYVEPLLVTLTSLATSGGIDGDMARICVLHTDLGPGAEQRLATLATALDLDLELTRAEAVPDGVPVSDWTSAAAYLRLQLPRALPSCDRVLYLDCDLIAVASLRELLDVVPERTVAAAQDTTNPTFGEGDGAPGFAELGIGPEQPYFNSGVMVIDTQAWIESNLTDRCMARLLQHPQHIRYWDQDALNIELAAEGFTRLDPSFNAIVVSAYEQAVAASGDPQRLAAIRAGGAIEAEASVLHFAGPSKPWNPGYPDIAAGDRYRSYVDLLARIEDGSTTLATWSDEVA